MTQRMKAINDLKAALLEMKRIISLVDSDETLSYVERTEKKEGLRQNIREVQAYYLELLEDELGMAGGETRN